MCTSLGCCPRILHMAAHASTATATEIGKRPGGAFEHLFEDTCDVDAAGNCAICELTPKILKIEESHGLALVTTSGARTVTDTPTSITPVAASTVVPPLPLSGVGQSISATIPFEVAPPPAVLRQGLDFDMMLNFQRVLETQAQMQQQQMAAMAQLFDAVSRMAATAPQQPAQPAGTQPAASSGPVNCTISEAELEHHIRSAPVISATTLSPELLKHLQKVTNNFEKTLLKRFKTEGFIDDVEHDVAAMGGDPCHYPAGTRPFRSPEDAFELDQPLDAAVGQETRVVITIPMGLSRRDAMQKVHHACALALKQFALEAAKARLVSLQPMCTRMAYFKSCNNFSQDNMDSLGLENGKIILPNQRLAVERAEDLYTKLVDKLRTKRVKEKKIADDVKEKRKKMSKTCSKQNQSKSLKS